MRYMDRRRTRMDRYNRRHMPMDHRRGENYVRYDNDYRRNYDYEYDHNRGDYYDTEHEYKEDLERWARKLERKDRFGLPKEEVLHKASDMGVKFKDYTEDEFYTTYLMLVSDFKNVSSEPHMYIAMAKQFLEDDDIAVDPSEKLCIYLYQIVLGEE